MNSKPRCFPKVSMQSKMLEEAKAAEAEVKKSAELPKVGQTFTASTPDALAFSKPHGR